jgi:hypothetical protein
MMAYDNCLTGAARNADDGKSDASRIALAIKSKCMPQADRTVKAVAAITITDGITAAQAYLSAKGAFEEQYLEEATRAVLSVRTGRIQ